EWIIIGDYKIGQQKDDMTGNDYVWTLPQGTKLKDVCGVETTFADAPTVQNNRKVAFTIKPLLFTGVAPTDGTMSASPGNKVSLKFNETMNPTSLAGHCSSATQVLCYSALDCGTGSCDGVGFTLTPSVPHLQVVQNLTDASKLDIYGDYR